MIKKGFLTFLFVIMCFTLPLSVYFFITAILGYDKMIFKFYLCLISTLIVGGLYCVIYVVMLIKNRKSYTEISNNVIEDKKQHRLENYLIESSAQIKSQYTINKPIVKILEQPKEVIDDYQHIKTIINKYLNQVNFDPYLQKVLPNTDDLNNYQKLDAEMKLVKMSAIDFVKLDRDSYNKYLLSKFDEEAQNEIMQKLCVPMKRAGYLDTVNKFYKYIYHEFGFSQTLMNSWAKVFVCNKQFNMAYRLFEIGDQQYQYRIKTGDLKLDPITTMLFGVRSSQCCVNMKKVEKAMLDYQYACQLVKDMGGNINIDNSNKLE